MPSLHTIVVQCFDAFVLSLWFNDDAFWAMLTKCHSAEHSWKSNPLVSITATKPAPLQKQVVAPSTTAALASESLGVVCIIPRLAVLKQYRFATVGRTTRRRNIPGTR